MASQDTLLLEHSTAHVVTLTINRPQVRNALDRVTMTQFAQIVDALQQDADLRAVMQALQTGLALPYDQALLVERAPFPDL